MKKMVIVLAIACITSPLYSLTFIVKNYYGSAEELTVNYSDVIVPTANGPAADQEPFTIKPGNNEFSWDEINNGVATSARIGNVNFNSNQLKKAVDNSDLLHGTITIVITSPNNIFLTKNGIRQ